MSSRIYHLERKRKIEIDERITKVRIKIIYLNIVEKIEQLPPEVSHHYMIHTRFLIPQKTYKHSLKNETHVNKTRNTLLRKKK